MSSSKNYLENLQNQKTDELHDSSNEDTTNTARGLVQKLELIKPSCLNDELEEKVTSFR